MMLKKPGVISRLACDSPSACTFVGICLIVSTFPVTSIDVVKIVSKSAFQRKTEKIKFSIKNFFRKCDLFVNVNFFSNHLLKRSLTENFHHRRSPTISKTVNSRFNFNKNTFTGLANCKKTTRHHAHQLCAKSRKTNDASPENGQKRQFRQFFDDFGVKYLQIANAFEKQFSLKLKVIFSTNFRQNR